MPLSGSNAAGAAYNIVAAGAAYNIINENAYGAVAQVWPTWNSEFVYVTASTTATMIWTTWVTVNNASNSASMAHQMYNATVRRVNGYDDITPADTVAADARADVLLNTILNAEQRTQFARNRFFEVVTGSTGATRRYRIKHGWAGNIFLLDDKGREVEIFCLHPHTPVPVADNLIAQKLLLETDEASFLRIANRRIIPFFPRVDPLAA